jgi:hypothetical protein
MSNDAEMERHQALFGQLVQPSRPRAGQGGNVQDRTAAEVVQLTRDEGVEIVDIRFCDLPGLMQHFSVPTHELTEDVFTEGLGFDGSSIRGFQEIQESDMLLLPDPVPPAQDTEPQLFRA